MKTSYRCGCLDDSPDSNISEHPVPVDIACFKQFCLELPVPPRICCTSCDPVLELTSLAVSCRCSDLCPVCANSAMLLSAL